MFTSLQGRSTLVCKQKRQFKGLIDTYACMSGMEGPLSTDQIQELVSQKPCDASGAYVLTEDKCRLYLENLGMWSLQTFDSLESNMKQVLVSSVAQAYS